MNRIYRLVWSTTRHAWIAASEFATAHRKSGRSALVGAVAASLVCAPVMPAFAATPYKNGSAFEKTVSGNPGLYVNDASNDSGCIFVHDTGDTGSTGWKYDSNNTNCLTSDKASQTARVLFYGSGTRTDGTDSLTLGNELYVNGGRIGLNNKFGTNPTNSMAIGNIGTDASGNPTGTRATAQDSVAIGNDAVASQQNAMALGTGAQANVTGGVALGSGSVAGTVAGQPGYLPNGVSPAQAAAINATTSTLGAIAVGDAATGKFRQITGLAAGTLDSDAVNVAQLKGLVGNATADAVMYDNATHNQVTLGGDSYDNSTHLGGTTVTNVANGVGDSDAVNVSQLHDLANTPITFVGNAGAVQKRLGEAIAIEGAASTPGSYSGSNLRTEVDANGNLQLQMADSPVFDSVTTGNTFIDSNGLTIAGGPSVTSGGIDAGNQRIVNVAPGQISDGSSDAVNGSQLHATNQQVDQNTTNISNLNTNIQNGTVGPVQRTGTDTLSLIAAGGDAYAPGSAQVLTNVAAGSISPTSTDAINGSQLHETNQNVTNVDNRVANVDNRVSNVFGDDSDANVAENGRGIRYVRTNDKGLPVDDAYAKGQGSTAVGYQAQATGDSALALGRNANASADNSVALGAGSTTTANLGHPAYRAGGYPVMGNPTGEVSVGSAGAERRVTNVAAGADETDAVNVSQLRGVADRTDQLAQDALLWDPTANGGNGAYNASHGGRGPSRITNVAAGDINASSTDAVNGSQLYEVTTQINNITLGGFKYFHASSQKPDSVASGADSIAVGPAALASGTSSLAMGDGANASASNASAIGSNAAASGANATAVGTGSSATGGSSVALGNGASASGERSSAIGAGASAEAANSVALGADSVADRDNSVSVGSVGNERQITNVKAGEADTDAVNVSQLREHGDAINSTITNVDNRVTQAKTDITQLQNGTDGMFQVNNSSDLPKPRPTGTDAVAGGAGAEASGSNSAAIGTRARASGASATALGNGSSAQAQNSVALGANSVADRANSVSVGSAGSERQITNVAAGTAPTDAVNVSQLQQSMGDISNQFYDYTDSRYNALRHDLKKQDDILSAGIAGAMAMATLPQPHSAGASMATVGLGNYRGQGALAIGVSRISDNGKWVTKLQGSTSSQGDPGVAVGIGYQW